MSLIIPLQSMSTQEIRRGRDAIPWEVADFFSIPASLNGLIGKVWPCDDLLWLIGAASILRSSQCARSTASRIAPPNRGARSEVSIAVRKLSIIGTAFVVHQMPG